MALRFKEKQNVSSLPEVQVSQALKPPDKYPPPISRVLQLTAHASSGTNVYMRPRDQGS